MYQRTRCFVSTLVLIQIPLGLPLLPAQANPEIYEVGVDPGVGFNLISWWNFGGSGVSTWQNAVQSLYDAGFREVSISPVRFVQINSGQNPGSIMSSSTRGPELSHIEAGVVRAKSLGMRVTLNPFVELVDGTNYFSFWRGQYDPTPGSAESTRFWSDYEDYLVEVAHIAEQHDVAAMNVGTELRAITRNAGNNSDWSRVINAVDATYGGSLGYAANWDNFKNSNLRNTIWEHPAIDYIGIDSYFQNLVTNAQADASGAFPDNNFISLVESAWNDKLDNDILPFAASRKAGAGMPVEFTEIGYLPRNRTTVTPQNDSGPLDTDEQTMAFNGLMRALDGRGDEFLAAHIWQWGMPGSNGSSWNMNLVNPDQPNNLATTQWLSDFVNTAVFIDGDFNDDGRYDCADIDPLVTEIAAGTNASSFDLTGDGQVNADDLDLWLQAAGESELGTGRAYLYGDANLDGVVDVSDFNRWNLGKFGGGSWCDADFNADGFVDVSDFNIWNLNKFQASDATRAVPEPAGGVGLMLCGLVVFFRRYGNRAKPLATRSAISGFPVGLLIP